MTAQTSNTHSVSRPPALRVATAALVGALTAAAAAALAGLAFLTVSPAEGSSGERVLAVAAAFAGIASAVLVIATLVIAQVFDLWALIPTRLRYAATAALILLAFALAIAR